MAIDIVFFLAPDDETAAETRPNGPGPALTSVTFHSFDPDDAVVEWELYFEAPCRELPPLEQLYKRDWPRYVAPLLNDGIGVFAVSEKLTSALADAGPSELRELTARWTERLRLAGEDDMTDDDPPAILEGVAQLAATAHSADGCLGLYCWHY
ncbi:hypothetical protein [Streptomyces spongiae]|uniref:Uncharacterized protein n=1 Tax=Streptomyces spongiae TaxID=565072 RepID=A0A5N8XFF2_9ACTN|nr:hypothetical protein [Streptomyces spongiae]MPY58201.1 hypothetical protein [Streptomyces spongiae]